MVGFLKCKCAFCIFIHRCLVKWCPLYYLKKKLNGTTKNCWDLSFTAGYTFLPFCWISQKNHKTTQIFIHFLRHKISQDVMCIFKGNMSCVTQKGPQWPESLSYQKKDGHAWPHQPFFWYDTNFFEILFLNLCIFFYAPILLSVWQRLRTLETFSCDAAHISCLQLSHFSLKSEFSSSCLSFECQKQIISCYIKLRRGKFTMSTEFLRDSIRKPSENPKQTLERIFSGDFCYPHKGRFINYGV